MIPRHLVQEVLAIPLPPGNCSDQLVWPFYQLGVYSTKSGYRSLYDLQRSTQPASNNSIWIHNGFNVWNLVWSLDVPEMIKIFLWKCLKGILPIRKNVASRLHHISPICPLCEADSESLDHLFCSCPQSITV